MSSLLRLERKQKIFQMHFEFAYFYFVVIHLELKRQLHSYAPVVPSKTTPDSRPKSAKCIPVFTPKRPKNPTLLGSAYLYGLYIREHPPCPSSRVDKGRKQFCGDRPPAPAPPYLKVWIWQWSIWKTLIITSCEQRAKRPPGPPPRIHCYSVLFITYQKQILESRKL